MTLLRSVNNRSCSVLRWQLNGWILLLLLLVAGCDDNALEPLQAGDVIVAFGDSLTAGKGVSESEAYPAVLNRLSGFNVVNAGISGETTEEGLRRLPSVLDEHDPELLILFEGGNDILRSHDLDKTKANLDAMIRLAKERDIQIVMVGLPRKQLFSSTAEFYTELAETHQIPMQADIVATLLRKPSMKSDRVHFNTAGYAALAESISELLDAQGAY